MKRRLIIEIHRDPPISGVAISSDEFITRELNAIEIYTLVSQIEELVLQTNSK